MTDLRTDETGRPFEAVEVGETADLGDLTVTEAEIRSFAEQYDPQSMHTDPAAAAEGAFDGVIASGWHTAAVSMRLFVDGYLDTVASVAGMSVEDLRWVAPVRPDDTLRGRAEVVDKEPRDDETGVLTVTIELFRDDERVFTRTDRILTERAT